MHIYPVNHRVNKSTNTTSAVNNPSLQSRGSASSQQNTNTCFSRLDTTTHNVYKATLYPTSSGYRATLLSTTSQSNWENNCSPPVQRRQSHAQRNGQTNWCNVMSKQVDISRVRASAFSVTGIKLQVLHSVTCIKLQVLHSLLHTSNCRCCTLCYMHQTAGVAHCYMHQTAGVKLILSWVQMCNDYKRLDRYTGLITQTHSYGSVIHTLSIK